MLQLVLVPKDSLCNYCMYSPKTCGTNPEVVQKYDNGQRMEACGSATINIDDADKIAALQDARKKAEQARIDKMLAEIYPVYPW